MCDCKGECTCVDAVEIGGAVWLREAPGTGNAGVEVSSAREVA